MQIPIKIVSVSHFFTGQKQTLLIEDDDGTKLGEHEHVKLVYVGSQANV